MLRSGRLGHVISLLAVVISLGLVPFGPATTAAQPTVWECPEPAANGSVAATPAASPAPAEPVAFPAAGGELTVFAAASLTDAFEAMQADLEAANPELTISYNFGGSQALVTQLTEGAQADVFASANNPQMDVAIEAGLVAGDPVTFVRNRLTVVTPAENPAGIASAADLGNEGLRLVLAQAEVPVGRYARESVCKMAMDAETYGDGFVERVAANVVSEEEDVRDVLTKVELGEADAGIVYVSDAAISGDQVQTFAIPDEVNVIATYPVAAMAEGDEALAGAFISYLLSAEGQATLSEFGFEPVA
jgi:molybdate transport system substrate-binding protein